jgi:hypothetical protein
MLARMIAATALLLTALPAAAQAPARHMEAFEKLCFEHARTATPLPDLAAAVGAVQVKNPLWPEYRDDGYPEHAFSWSDAPNTYVFMMTSRWKNIAPQCTLFVRFKGSEAGDLLGRIIDLSKNADEGVYSTMTLLGEYIMLGDRKLPFEARVTMDKHKKFGDFLLVSLWRPDPPQPLGTAAPSADPAAPQ